MQKLLELLIIRRIFIFSFLLFSCGAMLASICLKCLLI